MKTENGKEIGEAFWNNKEFWKDTALFLGLMALLYLAYIIISYWPEITEGFNRGWNSR